MNRNIATGTGHSTEGPSAGIQLAVLIVICLMAFLWNLGLNDVWTPNEGFYADAARRMLVSGNYFDIYYNEVPRFNKPPMMYWLIAFSGKLVGMNEVAVRLPSALAGLGTVLLVFLTGRFLAGRQTGIMAAAVMAFSFQFTINARYGTPEIVLTFFFTLTLYLFLLGYHRRKFVYLLFAYISLGLSILTKGYPYFFIIGLIALLYLLIDVRFRPGEFFRQVWFLRPYIGIPVAIMVGMAWILYMYANYGDDFHSILMYETFNRAFRRAASLRPFFYLEANTWGFLPYSLAFYFALFWLIFKRLKPVMESRAVNLSFSWFIVMLLVFSLAKGKIPTYFIQGYPGMSLMTAFFITRFASPPRRWQQALLQSAFIVPGVILTAGTFFMLAFLKAHPAFYAIAVLPPVMLFFACRENLAYWKLPYYPFYAFGVCYFLFTLTVMPYMEKFRPHGEIGATIREQVEDPAVPALVEEYMLHNLPFYAQRKMIEYATPEQISEAYRSDGSFLALIRSENLPAYNTASVLWEGELYEKSESRTLEFLIQCMKKERGEMNHFIPYSLVYRE